MFCGFLLPILKLGQHNPLPLMCKWHRHSLMCRYEHATSMMPRLLVMNAATVPPSNTVFDDKQFGGTNPNVLAILFMKWHCLVTAWGAPAHRGPKGLP